MCHFIDSFYLQQFAAALEDASSVGSETTQRDTPPTKVGANYMNRRWILNDEINHHKHGFVEESTVTMTLLYQERSGATIIPLVDDLILDMPSLVRKGLARLDTKGGKQGYRLRFVHDPKNHKIYVQRSGGPRVDAIASLPPTCAGQAA